MGYNIKYSVFGSAMAQLKLCFSFNLIICGFLSLCLFFKLCYTKEHKNDKECFWILRAWHKQETKTVF